MARSCDAIIIGAGPAGLATAAALQARGLNATILEKSDTVGAVWRRHYDRLHLHTDRARSAPARSARYRRHTAAIRRALSVVEYLEAYAAEFALKPIFNAPVHAVRRDGRTWRAEAGEHSRSAPIVVVATGLADYPHSPTWPGMEHVRRPDPAFEPLSQSHSLCRPTCARGRLRQFGRRDRARPRRSRGRCGPLGSQPGQCHPARALRTADSRLGPHRPIVSRREWPTRSTRPCFGSRSARSKSSA